MANKKVSQLTSKPSVLVTDLFPIADPSTGQLYKTTISDLGTAIGSGVSSVNGLVGAVVLDTDDIQELVSPTNKWFTDTRARAALSASSPLAYNSGTGVFSIPAATSSQNGYLTSTDWSTFNSKQAALSGTGFVKISGTTISYDNTAYLPLAGGTLTGALFGASASFSGFVGFGGNTSPLAAIDVTGAGIFSSSVRSSGYYLTGMTSGSGALYYNSGANRVTVANYNASGIVSFEVNGGSTALTLNSNLSATFASTLSATGATLTGALSGTSATFSGRVTGNGGVSSKGGYATFEYNSSATGPTYPAYDTYYGAIGTNFSNGGSELDIWNTVGGGFVFRKQTAASTQTALLTIASTGAATFSSSVTAGSGTSSGYATLNLIDSGTGSARYASIRKNYDSPFDLRIRASNSESSAPIVFDLSNAVEAMRITSAGNVGIGTTSPMTFGGFTNLTIASSTTTNQAALFLVNSNTTIRGSFYTNGNSNVRIGTATSHDFLFDTADTERMRITSVGAVQIGTRSDATESTANLALNNTNYGGFHFLDGTAYYIGQNSNFRSLRMYSGGSTGTGVNLAAGATSWGTYSDERMKTDLMPIENATEKVSQLRSVIGRYKTDEQSKKRSFLIAQDVKEVLPEAISEDLQTGMLEIRYTEVIPLLVASIKELKAELDALKA